MSASRTADVTFSERTRIAWPIVWSIALAAAPIIWMLAGMHRDIGELVKTVEKVVLRIEGHGDRITRLEAQR